MYNSLLLTSLFAGASVAADLLPRAAWSGPPSNYTAGLKNPVVTASSNGSAVCIAGDVPIKVVTQGMKINYPIPANQTVVTETLVEMLEAGSPLMTQIAGGMSNINSTYDINVQVCYPRDSGINADQVQLLTHGVGFDKSYWDVAPGYSYVDVAAASGKTTVSYDRLGVGKSAHPDAIQVVQAPVEVAILHSLTQMLRSGAIASTAFTHVVGVGHSFGSILSEAITAKYPKDFDAAILTGFSANTMGQSIFLAALDLTIAQLNDPIRFSGLSNGYLVANNYVGNQFAFFRAQGFPPANLAIAEATKDTVTLGELFTLSAVEAPAKNFTGAVQVVDGSNDFPFCQGNCSYPTNQAQAVSTMFPAAKMFETYLAPVSGHGINVHYSATGAFLQIQSFLRRAGL